MPGIGKLENFKSPDGDPRLKEREGELSEEDLENAAGGFLEML